MDKEILLSNINKIHATELGAKRIKKNLDLKCDNAVDYCKNCILREDCRVYKKGKNFYCVVDTEIITINSGSYTIITAKRGGGCL